MRIIRGGLKHPEAAADVRGAISDAATKPPSEKQPALRYAFEVDTRASGRFQRAVGAAGLSSFLRIFRARFTLAARLLPSFQRRLFVFSPVA